MGLAQSALILLGIGIVSSRFKAGTGLGELGAGITSLVAAPLTGTGTGLSAFSGGLRDLAETLGDLGRGFGTLFENIPSAVGPGGSGSGLLPQPVPILPSPAPLLPGFGGGGSGARGTLITNSSNDLVVGGGIRVPKPPPTLMQPIAPGFLPRPTIMKDPTVFQPGLSPDTNIYTADRHLVIR